MCENPVADETFRQRMLVELGVGGDLEYSAPGLQAALIESCSLWGGGEGRSCGGGS